MLTEKILKQTKHVPKIIYNYVNEWTKETISKPQTVPVDTHIHMHRNCDGNCGGERKLPQKITIQYFFF